MARAQLDDFDMLNDMASIVVERARALERILCTGSSRCDDQHTHMHADISRTTYGNYTDNPILAPGVPGPDVSRPRVSRPGVSQPDVSRPDVSRPDVPQPDVPQPGVSRSGVSRSGVSRPDVSRPDVPRPGVSSPDVSRPDVPQPSVSRPEVPRPDVSLPGVSRPDVPRPDVPQSGVSRIGVSRPDVPQPGVSRPGISQPDISRMDPAAFHALRSMLLDALKREFIPPIDRADLLAIADQIGEIIGALENAEDALIGPDARIVNVDVLAFMQALRSAADAFQDAMTNLRGLRKPRLLEASIDRMKAACAQGRSMYRRAIRSLPMRNANPASAIFKLRSLDALAAVNAQFLRFSCLLETVILRNT